MLSRTRVLLAVLLTLLVGDAGVHWDRARDRQAPPSIPRVDVSASTT